MIRVYKIRATIGGQLIGFDIQPLPEDFEDMEAAETAIRAFNDDKQELFVWEPAAQITVPPDSVTCVFEDFDERDARVSVWIAVAEEHTRMLTRDMIETRLKEGALPPIMPSVVTEEEAQRIRAAGPGEILPQQIKRGAEVFFKGLDRGGKDRAMINTTLERWFWRFNATMMPEGFYARPDTYPPLPKAKPDGGYQRRFYPLSPEKTGNRKQRRKAEAKDRKSRG